jgi:hypothetical protein
MRALSVNTLKVLPNKDTASLLQVIYFINLYEYFSPKNNHKVIL